MITAHQMGTVRAKASGMRRPRLVASTRKTPPAEAARAMTFRLSLRREKFHVPACPSVDLK